MAELAKGTVVLVPFPFSDLSQSKLRPALVLAPAGRGDYPLCQITSNPYGDAGAISVTTSDFATGSLPRESYVRPLKNKKPRRWRSVTFSNLRVTGGALRSSS